MKKRAYFILTVIIFLLAVVFVRFVVIDNQRVPYSPVETTKKTPEETVFECAVMKFTPEEADAALARFQAEKEETARQARIRARATYSPSYFRRAGVLHWGGWRWTWYSERILPGHGLRIPGRHTDAQGYVRDGNGYLCLASDALRRGTVIETPLGSLGKVYDCGCGTHTIDVYVGW